MNVIQFKKNYNKKIVFCMVDRLSLCQDNFSKEIVKNIGDYSISNIYEKGYDILQGLNEDELLKKAVLDNYQIAVVFSTGTEFINGKLFFEKVEELIKTDFFISGHVLDRNDAYYELHHQCYIINLDVFKKLEMPFIGELELGSIHNQFQPIRSQHNHHDKHTPLWVKSGTILKEYNHKCHGWNILKQAFQNQLQVLVFDEEFRSSKKHHYPESKKDFLKNLPWIYYRDLECATNFIHKENTEESTFLDTSEKFEQIVIPASGPLYHDHIDTGSVIIYDYNQQALDYWSKNFPRKTNVTYSFVNIDLLGINNLVDYILPNKKTLINLSNIFCYEGTAALKPLYYRLYKENELILQLQNKNPDIVIAFSKRAASGFVDLPKVGNKTVISPIHIESLKKPTWHYNSDWC